MPQNSSVVHSIPYFAIEDKYKWTETSAWFASHFWIPILAIACYLTVIHYGQQFMRERKRFELKGLLFLWNTGLALFSMWTAMRALSLHFYELLSPDYDCKRMLCDRELDNVSGFWGAMFTLSKLVELGDTVFLIIRKRPVIFLHWYHHVTVLLFTWLATSVQTPSGKFFVTMNACVHSIMYSYYASMSLGHRFPRLVSLSITLIQISQMVGGIVVLSFSQYYASLDSSCYAPTSTLVAGVLMYASYFALFVHFFLKAYVFPDTKRKAV